MKFWILKGSLLLACSIAHASTGIDHVNEYQVKKFSGEMENSYTGHVVKDAGDINGDLINDIIIGSNQSSGTFGAYVVLGRSDRNVLDLPLSSLSGENGFKIITTETGDSLGFAVDKLGDVNGDGLDDLIVGAHTSSVNGTDSGQAFVIYGSEDVFPGVFNVSDLNGKNGFAINGADLGTHLGFSVSYAGDVNNDGTNDILIGNYFANHNGVESGSVYLIFGSKDLDSPAVDINTLNGLNGFRVDGEVTGDRFGGSVSSAGDFNDDGFDDLLIGAILNDSNGDRSGSSYVVFGQSSFAAIVNTNGLDGTDGISIVGEASLDRLGYRVLGAGDVNMDDIDDVMISSLTPGSLGSRGGIVYIVFGQSEFSTGSFDVGFSDGLLGSKIIGRFDHDTLFGFSFTTGFDLNGDGFSDFAVGAPFMDSDSVFNGNGVLFIIYGGSWVLQPTIINIADLNGINGFAVHGEHDKDELGVGVSSVIDWNGDGFNDLLVGARRVNNKGSAYLMMKPIDLIFKNGF